jgi:HEAT repeat protein
MPKPLTAKKATVKSDAGTKKGRTTKTVGVHAGEKKPVKKADQQAVTVKRTLLSPEDQSYVLNDLAVESQSTDEQVSLGAIDRLGHMEDTRATVCLAGCLKDPRFIVRIYAAARLGERRDASAVEPLIEALHDESVFVRQTVAGALEHIGGEKALQAVKEAETKGLLLNELPEGRRLDPPLEP